MGELLHNRWRGDSDISICRGFQLGWADLERAKIFGKGGVRWKIFLLYPERTEPTPLGGAIVVRFVGVHNFLSQDDLFLAALAL